MKFSNIACVALLGATLATSAYATETALNTTGTAYDKSASQFQFFNALQGDLSALKTADKAVIVTGTTADTASNLTTTNTDFTKLLNDMFTLGKNVIFGTAGVVLDSLGTDNYKITLMGDDNTKGLKSIQISDSGATNYDTITLGGSNKDTLQVTPHGAGIVSATTTGLANDKLTEILNALPTSVDTKVEAKAKSYLDSLQALTTDTTPATADFTLLTNVSNNAETVQLLKENIAAIAIKQANTDKDNTSKLPGELKTANEKLAQSGATIKIGNTTYNGTSTPLTKDAITALTTSSDFVGVVKIDDAVGSDVDTATGYLTSYSKIIENNTIVSSLSSTALGSTTGIQTSTLHATTAALDTNPFTDDSLKKELGLSDIKDLNKLTPAQVAKFAAKFEKIKTDLTNASKMTDATAKKTAELQAIKEAIDNGLKFSADTTASNGTALENTSSLTASSGANSPDQATQNALSLFGSSKSLGQLLTAVTNLETAYSARANAIANYNDAINTNPETLHAANALGALSTNEVATGVLTNATTAQVVSTVKNITSSTNEIASSLTTKSFDVLRNSDNLSTSTRLAMLSNPYNADLGLASAIDKLSTNKTTFASMDNSSLSSVIKEYTNRFENDANVWANVIGGKGIVKDGMNSTVFGGTAGYDKRLDNTILGGYLSYAKSRATAGLNSVNTDNIALGFYGRTFIDNNEIDYKASVGVGRSKTNRNFGYYTSDTRSIASQEGKFSSTFANLGATYGYVIDMGSAMFIKPLVGLDYNYVKTGAFDETQTNTNLAEHFGGLKSSELSAKLGVELRKYLSTGNYFYITPAISTDLYKSKKDLLVNYIGSNENINVPIDNKKGTYFVLNTGLDLKVTDKVSTNISFGTKVGSKAQYYNGTFGIRYAF